MFNYELYCTLKKNNIYILIIYDPFGYNLFLLKLKTETENTVAK